MLVEDLHRIPCLRWRSDPTTPNHEDYPFWDANFLFYLFSFLACPQVLRVGGRPSSAIFDSWQGMSRFEFESSGIVVHIRRCVLDTKS